jgi:hypothetical protein
MYHKELKEKLLKAETKLSALGSAPCSLAEKRLVFNECKHNAIKLVGSFLEGTQFDPDIAKTGYATFH